MPTTYRRATVEDIDAIAKLSDALHSPPHYNAAEYHFTYEDCVEMHTEQMAEDAYAFFLAFCGEEAIGLSYVKRTCDFEEDGVYANLYGIYVKPEYRGQGIAKQLVSLCEDWAKEQGCYEFCSTCHIDNNDSTEFHLKIGFIESYREINFIKKLKL